MDGRRGKPSRRRVLVATVEKVFGLYREKYFDLNVQHSHEKLQAEHGIELPITSTIAGRLHASRHFLTETLTRAF